MAGAKPQLLCLSHHVPHDGVRHAGGAFVLRHLRALSAEFAISTLVPATDYSLPVAGLAPEQLHVDVVGRGRRHGPIANTVERVRKVLAGVSPGASATRSFLASPQLDEAVRRADVVEIQWSEMLVTAPYVRSIRPELPIVGVCHDVIVQALQRKGDAAPWHRRVFYRLAAARARSVERALLACCDVVFVFSEKDRSLLQTLGVERPIHVIDPDLQVPKSVASPAAAPPTVLFVGAMDRRENFEGILEFLDGAWARVKQAVPAARLLVVGTEPPAFLQARSGPDVVVTGAVDDLAPFYREACVFVAPLRLGAGLKFKVPQAMLYGLPVVSTSVGAEGIVDDAGAEVFAAVEDDMTLFADAVAAALSHPDHAAEVGRRARDWALRRFDFDRSTQRIADTYLSLIDEARRPDPSLR